MTCRDCNYLGKETLKEYILGSVRSFWQCNHSPHISGPVGSKIYKPDRKACDEFEPTEEYTISRNILEKSW